MDAAIGGNPRDLHALLARGSHLPGPRPNIAFAERFAAACVARGKRADGVVRSLVALDPDVAPGATELEFLPLAGVVALGARATADPACLGAVLASLEAASEDLRFRVREAVAPALARIGAVVGESLLRDVEPWMGGFFPTTSVIVAAARVEWLSRMDRPDVVVARLEAAFALARDADRSAERFPGYKALVAALGESPGIVAARFGEPVYALLERMSASPEPMLREAVEKNLAHPRLARRHPSAVARVRAALDDAAPKPRDPRADVGPTRGRGRKRKRR